MKKLLTLIVLALSVSTLALADQLEVNGVSTQGGHDNLVGTGLTDTQSGGSDTIDFSGLQTTQGNTNASNITNLSNSLNTTNTNVSNLTTTVNNNSTNVSNLQTTVSNNSSQISTLNNNVSGIQNMTDNSLLTQTVNNHSTQISNLNTQVGQNTAQINQNTSNIKGLQNEVDEQNKTKMGLDFEVRLLDSKRWSLYAYDIWQADTDPGADVLGGGHNFMFGSKVVFKLGKSYEEERLDAQKSEMDALRAEIYALQHVHAPSAK